MALLLAGGGEVIYDIALEDTNCMACMEKRFQCCYQRSELALKQQMKNRYPLEGGWLWYTERPAYESAGLAKIVLSEIKTNVQFRP